MPPRPKGLPTATTQSPGRSLLSSPNGTKGSQKQRYPNGQGGTTIVEAAVHYGCQLEWMHDVYSAEQAERIKAVLEQDAPKAVANGCH